MKISTITLTLTVEHDCGDNDELLHEAIAGVLVGMEHGYEQDDDGGQAVELRFTGAKSGLYESRLCERQAIPMN